MALSYLRPRALSQLLALEHWAGELSCRFEAGGFASICHEVTTKLIGYRIYLSPDVFVRVHHFKRTLQDLMTAVDILTRPDEGVSLASEIPIEAKVRIDGLCDRIRNMCDDLIPILRDRMTRLSGDLTRDSNE
jgi:hypothetical protein